MANYRHGATYGSLAYDLDALAREKQLDEAGKLPQKKVRPAQPEGAGTAAAERGTGRGAALPCSAAGNGAGGGHGHRADAVLCEADRHFR
mgnify:CR=1 FL=1